MPMAETSPATRTMRGWVIAVLLEAGAIRECEEHGWMRERGDPHAREHALDIARGSAASIAAGSDPSSRRSSQLNWGYMS